MNFFGKKKNTGRSRDRDEVSVSPVFSYHSSRFVRSPEQSPQRKASKLTWLVNGGGQGVGKARSVVNSWSKRIRFSLMLVSGLLAVAYWLSLSRNPNVVLLPSSKDQQAILLPTDRYTQVASEVFKSSLLYGNRITIDTSRAEQDYKSRLPELERVSVTVPLFGRSPTIHIAPYKPVLVLKTLNGETFVLNYFGKAIQTYEELQKNKKSIDLPLMEDQSGLQIEIGKTALPASDVMFVVEVLAQLKAKKVETVGIALPAAASQLDVRVKDRDSSYLVKFDLKGNGRAQAGTYLAVREHLEQGNKMPQEYVDVRVSNKAYYK